MQNTFIYYPILLLITLFLAACESHNDKAASANTSDDDPLAKMKSGANDTSIYLHCRGESKKFTFNKQFVDSVLRMQKMADIYQNKPLDSTLIIYKDVTNDGVDEKLVSRLYFSPDTFFVGRWIYQKDSLIYRDIIAEKVNTGKMISQNIGSDFESIHYFLYPYSLYIEDLDYLYIIKYNRNFDLVKYVDDPESLFFKRKGEELAKMNLPARIIEQKIAAYKSYIRNYKGNIISQPYHDEEGEFPEIWYTPEKRFIELL